MDYEYTELSVGDRAKIAQDQVRQFEGELFGHDLNKARAEALPAKTPGRDEGIKAAEDAQAVILSALETTKAALAGIEAEAETEKA